MTRVLVVALCAFHVAACGGTVNDSSSAAATGGNAGTAGAAGSGGGPNCTRSNDAVALSLIAPEGTIGCDPSTYSGSSRVVEGIVTASNANSLQVDSCPPSADCLPMVSSFTAAAPGLALKVPTGSFVRITFTSSAAWMFCTTSALVERLTQWDGQTNPDGTTPRVWLAASDGELASFAATPFQVSSQPILGCEGPSGGASKSEEHVLRVVSPLGETALVPMGQTASVAFSGRGFRVRNLRTFVSGYYDDYWNWGYLAQED